MGKFIIGRINANRLLADELARMGIAAHYVDNAVEFDYTALHHAVADMASAYVRTYWERLLNVKPCKPSHSWVGTLGYELEVETAAGILKLLTSCEEEYLKAQAIARMARGFTEHMFIIDRATQETITVF